MVEGLNFVEMGSKMCLNELCGATTSSEWKQGWRVKSGGFASLCYSCGLAYENSVFCETFHNDESGWRQCTMCGKRLHCGCIASMYLHETLDFGGVGCINCVRTSDSNSMRSNQLGGDDNPNATFVTNDSGAVNPMAVQNQNNDETCFERLLQMTNPMGPTKIGQVSNFHEDGLNAPLMGPANSTSFPNFSQSLTGSSTFMRTDIGRQKEMAKELFEPLNQPSLNFSLSSSLGGSKPVVPHFPGGVIEAGELNLRGPMGRDALPNPRKPSTLSAHETKKGSGSQTRVARPPAEGRGRNQLLPRYWPKITDQELKQLSGDLKSTIVPLFEKVLSASDAGRIGRLVLPKACAEAYFPPINQSEGIPIRIQDIKGKEWTFQFRFWPNNNSRMYVLEGVTPCIQNMQVQAGDIVTFSRIDPGNQLVIGCRKAADNADMQDQQTAALPSDDSLAETAFSGPIDNLPSNGAKTNDQHKPMGVEKKKSRNMKNKRLHMNNDDAMELSVTWEEAQELMRPPPNVQPTIFMIDGYAIEEYEVPPVFGKRIIFTSDKFTGEQQQLTQCDNCLKWRRLPADVVLTSKWTCLENIWDANRSSCSVPEDINPSDLNALLKSCKESKKRRTADNKGSKEGESSGLDALATAAVLGDNMEELAAAESLVGATTKHPRHRPGCTCIVCIQPPSGKGKHDPTCECNVCSTVKRRFKTLMLRKKQRQSAELALGKDDPTLDAKLENEEAKLENEDEIARRALMQMNLKENGKGPMVLDEDGKEELDLNYNPGRGNDPVEAAKLGLMALTKDTDIPSEEVALLKIETTPISQPDVVGQTAGQSGEQHIEEKEVMLSRDVEQENKVEGKENKVEEN